ncbi:MAG: MurR/RpiR family transcriptional regulator, partial [Paracoccaceae bacterium]|nr:MurR/RpiR family transcriptional regulator [Paracoccaceae bacterium]
MPFDQKIRDIYKELPNSERAVADVMLEFPGDIAIYTSGELAERANSSNSAVTRLIKRVGYKDYREVQREVREAQIQGVGIYRTTSHMHEASPKDSFAEHLSLEMKNLQETFAALSNEDFTQAATATKRARRVWVIGFRNGFFFASYLRRQLIQIRPNVVLLPVGGQSIMEDLADATPDDVVIAIGVRRRAPILKEAMRLLHSMDVPIVYFCDHRAVTTRNYSRWSFSCLSAGTILYDSCTTVLSAIYFFIAEVYVQSGRPTQDRMALIEARVDV